MQAARHALLLSIFYGQGFALQGSSKEEIVLGSEEGAPIRQTGDLRGAYGYSVRPTTGQSPWLLEQLRLLASKVMQPVFGIMHPPQDLRPLKFYENRHISEGLEAPVHILPSLTNAGPENTWAKHQHSPNRLNALQFNVSASSALDEWGSFLSLGQKLHRTTFLRPYSDYVRVRWPIQDSLTGFWALAGCSYVFSIALTMVVWMWFYAGEDAEEEEVDAKTMSFIQKWTAEDQGALEDADEDQDAALRAKLEVLSAEQLKEQARKAGATPEELDGLEQSEDPIAAIIDLIMKYKSEQDEEDVRSSRHTLVTGRNQSSLGKAINDAVRQANLNAWLKATEEERYRSGALTLTNVGIVMLIFALAQLSLRPACAPINWWVHGPETGVLILVIVKTAYCIYEPQYWLYWAAVAFYCAYIPAAMLPPFQMSCEELHEKCGKEKNMFTKQAVSHLNCSLQGQTSQQVMMTLFLLLPWLLPRFKMMYLTLIWMVGVYVVWTMAYLEYTDREYYNTMDICLRIFLLCATFWFALKKKEKLQKSQVDRWISDQNQAAAKRRLMEVLMEMLPAHVISRVYKYGRCSDPYPIVSIMFVVIDDFEEIVSKKSTKELLAFLNSIFTELDQICVETGVTKIETVGEEYVCCVGVTPDDAKLSAASGGHETILENLFKAADKMMQKQTDEMKFKIGVHTGPIIAGVVGQKLPRYRLVGDTINTAARMMQKGLVGQVQFGEETKMHLPVSVQKAITERGLVEMKGKGQVQTYLFSGMPQDKATEDVLSTSVPDDATTSALPSAAPDDATATKRVTIAEPEKPEEPEEPEEPKESEAAIHRRVMNRMLQGGLLSKLLAKKDRLRTNISLRFSTKSEASEDEQSTLGEQSSQVARSRVSTQASIESLEEEMLHEDPVDDVEEPPEHWLNRFNIYQQLLNLEKGFTEEMEMELQREQHESFMKKIIPNIDKTFVAVLVVSTIEGLFMIYEKSWNYDHDLFHGKWRIPAFIVCRILVWVPLSYCRAWASQTQWSFAEPAKFQKMMVFSVCWGIMMLLFSYDVLTIGEKQYKLMALPSDQIFSLIFMLLFFLTIRWKFLFYQSLWFVGLASVILLFINLRRNNGIYFPYIGQVLFFMLALSNSVLAYSEEQSMRSRFKAQHAARETKTRIKSILETMMPPLVLKGLKSLDPALVTTVHDYKKATIAQSDLCGFTKLASTRTPDQVVDLIGEIFTAFDNLTDKLKIYKVETVGDAYIAGMAEEPLTKINSPHAVVTFGIEMVKAVRKWSQSKNLNVNCRVGVHHGKCVGGIVGTNQQRYHLFGKLLVGLEVLESTGIEGGVQLSIACKEAVEKELPHKKEQSWCVERTEEHLKTSKGEVHEFSEAGGRTWIITDI